MALRDQPYLPLYIQDYLTDEKLNMCSAATQGIYIKIMCIMHKSDEYGKILLKQKDKQHESTCLNFAAKIAKILPFHLEEIETALEELIDENVLHVENDELCQKRMIKDNELSIKRSLAGKKGGLRTQQKDNFAQAKQEASTEIENEDVNTKSSSIENTKVNTTIEDFYTYFEIQPFQERLRIDVPVFINGLYQLNLLNVFIKQFEAYKELKDLEPKYKHSPQNFMYQWQNENWEAKLKDHKKTLTNGTNQKHPKKSVMHIEPGDHSEAL